MSAFNYMLTISDHLFGVGNLFTNVLFTVKDMHSPRNICDRCLYNRHTTFLCEIFKYYKLSFTVWTSIQWLRGKNQHCSAVSSNHPILSRKASCICTPSYSCIPDIYYVSHQQCCFCINMHSFRDASQDAD